MTRIATGLALALLVLATVRWAPLWVFWTGLGLVTLLAVHELRELLERLDRPSWPWLTYAGSLALTLSFLAPERAPLPVLTALVILAFLRALVSRAEPQRGADRIVGTMLPVLYVGLLAGHVGGLLAIEPPRVRETGEDLLILALVIVYVGDTTAYYGGRLFGRHPLAPRISPAKTWEGALANLAGSVGGALLGPFWFFHALSWQHAVALGLLVGTAGILGDLSESLLKRAAAVKDSGGLLPGHGGVLDRIDSLLLAGPVLFWYHRWVLGG
ncbi:MAG: hypothetical protein Kow0062_16860 [Acidobacteriota bacterium]